MKGPESSPEDFTRIPSVSRPKPGELSKGRKGGGKSGKRIIYNDGDGFHTGVDMDLFKTQEGKRLEAPLDPAKLTQELDGLILDSQRASTLRSGRRRIK